MTGELRRDVLLPLVVLMAIVVGTSIGAVALLSRMAPAIERIISENIYSIEAAEEMLSVVASDQPDEHQRALFETALARAEGNITEARERQGLDLVRARKDAALGGDAAARAEVVDALRVLSMINRDAVVRGDAEAQRLGYASSWAAVFLGAISFAWGLLAVRRARVRLLVPLQEVAAVLQSARGGDAYRRCRRIVAPSEIEHIMSGVDDLLDARALRGFAREPAPRGVADRAVLLHMLEQHQGPTFVALADGTIEAANRAGLDLVHEETGAVLHERLRKAIEGDASVGVSAIEISAAHRWLCEVS